MTAPMAPGLTVMALNPDVTCAVAHKSLFTVMGLSGLPYVRHTTGPNTWLTPTASRIHSFQRSAKWYQESILSGTLLLSASFDSSGWSSAGSYYMALTSTLRPPLSISQCINDRLTPAAKAHIIALVSYHGTHYVLSSISSIDLHRFYSCRLKQIRQTSILSTRAALLQTAE